MTKSKTGKSKADLIRENPNASAAELSRKLGVSDGYVYKLRKADAAKARSAARQAARAVRSGVAPDLRLRQGLRGPGTRTAFEEANPEVVPVREIAYSADAARRLVNPRLEDASSQDRAFMKLVGEVGILRARALIGLVEEALGQLSDGAS